MNEEWICQKYREVLRECGIFHGIPENEYPEILEYLRADLRHFGENEYLLHTGDTKIPCGIVLSGTAEALFYSGFVQFEGNQIAEGEMFGAEFVCSEPQKSTIQIRTVTECDILFLNLKVLFDTSCPFSGQMSVAVNIIKLLACQNIFLTMKLRIYSQTSLRNKVLAYLYSMPSENGIITMPFNQTKLAKFLGVNRSALSRELGRMVDEGIIKTDGKTIEIIKKAVL